MYFNSHGGGTESFNRNTGIFIFPREKQMIDDPRE